MDTVPQVDATATYSMVTADRRRDLIEELMAAGRAMSTATVLFHEALAEKVGLSTTEDKAVELLDRLGPLTAGDMAGHSGLATASVTALVDRLERKGFARRIPHPSDRRRVLVEAVPDRVSSVSALLTSWVAVLNEIFADYGEDELETILGFLNDAARRQRELISELTDSV